MKNQVNPLSDYPIKHTQTQQPTNRLSVFDHFARLVVKGLTFSSYRTEKVEK